MQKILIVGEDGDSRRVAANILGIICKDFEIFEAEDGEKGLQMICELHPDLVVSDGEMPKMSGPEMIERARKHHNFCSIISHDGSEECGQSYVLKAGAHALLMKPYGRVNVMDTLSLAIYNFALPVVC